MLNVKSARRIILAECARITPRDLPCETIQLQDAFQRVLAETILVDRDYPPFARSMRDGYALLAKDVQRVPVDLRCIGEIKAGDEPNLRLSSGEAIQIMTGAPVPPFADAVVMIESTKRLFEGGVRILKTLRPGDNISPKGSERKQGEHALFPFRRINSLAMAVLASVGKSCVKVVRKPTVSILATGDELVAVDKKPGPTKIRNSNAYSLYAQVTKAGGNPVVLKTAPDDISDLQEQFREGLKSDVLLISGGVSRGKYDLVEPALAQLGAVVHFESVKMRPGKPTVFATQGDKWIFGLPGNPLSTFVAFELFVQPVLKTLQGLDPRPLALIAAVLQSEITEKSGRTAFLPAKLYRLHAGFGVEPVAWKGSADIFSASDANGLIIVPLEASKLSRGESVEVIILDTFDTRPRGVF